MVNPLFKKCIACKKEKAITEFHVNYYRKGRMYRRSRCGKCSYENAKKYRDSRKYKDLHIAQVQRNRAKFPERERSRALLKEAVRLGKIQKSPICFECGENKRIQAHHEDYSKPFDVEWLCSRCHTDKHKNFSLF